MRIFLEKKHRQEQKEKNEKAVCSNLYSEIIKQLPHLTDFSFVHFMNRIAQRINILRGM